MRAVLDTNVIVSSFVFGGRLAPIRRAWAVGALVPVMCRTTADELIRVLGYAKFKLDATSRKVLEDSLVSLAEMRPSPEADASLLAICRDRSDVIFIALAQSAGVPLVSGDKDLSSLRTIAPVEVLSPAELIARLPA